MILAATGLLREARLLRGPGVRPIVGGGRSDALEAALLQAAGEAQGIISIGLGGALAAGLRPGDWVVADRVVWPGDAAETDPDWTAALARRLGARRGVVFSSEAMLTDRSLKAEAARRWNAIAVDMESQAAAVVARRFGLPFAAVRVISDAAEDNLAEAVKVGIAADGRMAAGAVLLALLRKPGQTPALVRTAWAAGRAFSALAQGRRLLGPRLGFPDLG
jgi:nucleoside phosphorylase